MKRPGLSWRLLLVLVAFCALFGSDVLATTATSIPSLCANATDVGTIAWISPASATVTDDSYATVAVTDNAVSNYLKCTAYDFSSIPSWAVINGITVKVERKSSTTSATVPTDAQVHLIKAGTIVGDDKATTTSYTTADVVEAHGSATSLWGASWTPADLKASNFGVAFSTKKPGTAGGSRTVSVDFVGVAVDYTIPARACVSVKAGNWSDAATWNCGAGAGDGPPAATDSASLAHAVLLDTSASVTALSVAAAGSLTQTGSASLTLNVSGNFTNSGAVADNGASGGFDLAVGGTLTANGTSFVVDNLTVAGNTINSTAFTVNGSFKVGGDLTASSAGVFTADALVFQKAGSQAVSFYGTSSVVGNFTVNSGSTVTSTASFTLNLKGNLLVNGTLSLPNAVWLANGTAAQSVGGASDTTLGSLVMNNPSGLSLSGNVSVPSLLTLTSGVITAGTYRLSVSASCPNSIVGGSAASYVNGRLRLTYPGAATTCVYHVGDAAAYAPISVTIPTYSAIAGISGATLTGSTTGGEHPQLATSGIDPYLDVNRYWTLGESDDTLPSKLGTKPYTVGLGFVLADVDAGATVGSFKVGKYAASTWSTLAGTASATTATLTGQTSFGSYAVGTPVLPVTLTKTASSGAAAVNSYVTFTLGVSNPNAVDVNNVVVTDVIPSGMTYRASAATLGSASASGQTLTWTIPSLKVGASTQLSLVVQPTAQGTLTNTVTSGLASASATVLILPESFVQYRMDETAGSWTATVTPGAVIDNGVHKLNGHRRTTATPTTTNAVVPAPTIAASALLQSTAVAVQGGFCNAGNFDGNAVVESPASDFFQFTNKLSASAWIYPTAYPASGNIYSILSNDTNYEFHLDHNGHLYWWWQSASLTSAAVIPLNQWTHVAITFDSSDSARQYIYINGVLDSQKASWSGTLQPNACPFYIGGDIHTDANCALIPARNFHGKIDEVKIYDYELSAAEVKADMTLGRLCGGVFDHIRIEHDGTASTCAPKTVVLKACMNASCTALYPGPVQVTLSPSGWTSGDTVTINGGVTSATLASSSISAPKLTLGGTAYGATLPVNTAARCFNGSTETCELSVASNSCKFDAAEVGGLPQTHLFTKLAGIGFNLDVLAVGSTPTSVDTSSTSTVAVDLVDASSLACSSASTALNSAQTVTLVKGRQTVPFTIAAAVPGAQVRVKSGSTYACSSDKFAIRPQQFTVSAPAMSNTELSGTPKAVAGSAFTLSADSGVSLGYNGTPALKFNTDLTPPTPLIVAYYVDNDSKNAKSVTSETLLGTFNGVADGVASGRFRYLNVGTIQLAKDAVVDSSFSAVDHPTASSTDCIVGSTSNVLSGGLYGCNVGSAAASRFGRWVPSHYSFAGTLLPVWPDSATQPAFVYMAQDALKVNVALKAHALGDSAAAATDPVLSLYTAGYPNLAAVTLAGDNNGTTVAASRLANPDFPTMPNTALWNSGVFEIDDTYAFSKLAAGPDGPYDLFKLKASLIDPDGALLIDPSETNTTSIRYGRVRLGNAYGSELLALPLDLRLQYWAGQGWLSNSPDTATAIKNTDFAFDFPVSAKNALAACETAITIGGAAPNYTATLSAPGLGHAGWTNVRLNLGAAASGTQCSVKGGVGAAAETVAAPWLQFNWTGIVGDPSGLATFGGYKSGPIIYRREMY